MSTSTIPATNLWSIDPAHSHVEFAVRHMMVATAKGRFSDVSGTVEFDGVSLRGAKVDVEIAGCPPTPDQIIAALRSVTGT